MATTFDSASSEIDALLASFDEILESNGIEGDSLNQTESVERASFSDSFQQFQEFTESRDFSLYGVEEPQTIMVDSPEALMQAINTLSATGGEIVLTGDDYGMVDIKNIDPAVPLVIRGDSEGEAPVFEGMKVTSSSNLVFDSIEVHRVLDPDEPTYTKIVWADGNENLAFVNSEFQGSEDGDHNNDPIGVSISDSTGVILENNDFHDLMRGTVNSEVSELIVKGNAFHDIRSDGADFTIVDNAVIEGNYFRDFYPNLEAGDHADAIQFWTNTGSSSHVEIRGNIILQGEGSSGIQGVFLGDKSDYFGTDFGYSDFTIEGNVYHGSAIHGITLEKMDSAFIANNTVIGIEGEGLLSAINVEPTATNIHVQSNITTSLNVGEHITDDSNMVVTYSPTDESGFIYDILYNPGAVDNIQLTDLGLAPGVEIEGLSGAITPSSLDSAILSNQNYGDSSSLSVQLDTYDPQNALVLDEGQQLEWHMGDGTILYGENVDHTYETGGSFDVVRLTRNPDGSVANSLTKSITVQSPELLDVNFDNTLANATEYANSGEWMGAPNYETGLVGAGATFSPESGAYITFATPGSLEGSTEFTVQFDLQTDQTDITTPQRPIWQPGSFGIQIENDESLSFYLWHDDGSVSIMESAVPDLFDSEWHNLAFSIDGDANTATAWLDDVEIGTMENAPSFLTTSSGDLYVGGTPWGRVFDGTMDNLKISQSVYEPPVDPGLVEASGPEAVLSETFDDFVTQTYSPEEALSYVNLGRSDEAFGTTADDDQMSLYIDFKVDDMTDDRQRLVWNHMDYGIEFQDDNLVFYMWTDDNASIRAVVNNPDISDNGWHQVGFTYDEATGAFRGYLDGEEVASIDNAGASLQEARYWDLVVGGTAWGQQFEGEVDNLHIYKEIVKPEDVDETGFDVLASNDTVDTGLT